MTIQKQSIVLLFLIIICFGFLVCIKSPTNEKDSISNIDQTIGQWKRIDSPTNENIHDIFFVDSQTGWVLSRSFGSNSILKTVNGGEKWYIQMNTNNNLSKVHFIDKQTGWITGQQTWIYTTKDGGENWIEQKIPILGYTVHFLNKNIGWLGGFKGIYKTNDGGISWTNQVEIDHVVSDLFFLNNEIGWATSEEVYTVEDVSGSRGFVYRTKNGGQNWAKSEGLGTVINTIQFFDPLNGYVNSVHVYKSNDGGKTWIKTNDSGSKNMYFVNNNVGWIVGVKVIGYTKDSGSNWEYIKTDDYLSTIFFYDLNNGWAGGSNGTILKYYH